MREPVQFSLRALLICVTVFCVALALLASWAKWGDKAGKQASCRGLHLHLIAAACSSYHMDHGTLPPAYIADEDGKPMHSWRVLLLPYMARGDLYARYDFSEPWNGPNNSKLAQEVPHVYRCPAYRGNARGKTNYVAVVGPQTAWPGNKGVPEAKMTDSRTASPTILIVEVAESGYNWMEPRDMSFEQALSGVNVDMRQGISSQHGGGAFCGFFSGSSGFLPEGTDRETLKALLTISGGERIEEAERFYEYRLGTGK